MKKIININLSGRVIPIEDTAYEKLQAYIESLRRYFAHEDGRDEIINDIESRIAELMNDKVRKGASAVTDLDIDQIIASMGRPEDFDAEETLAGETGSTSGASTNASAGNGPGSGSATSGSTSTNTGSTRHRRLYRNNADKFIGGVCSGIAAYLNVDPAFVRILFAIISFGGFGFGFILYLILWAVLPTSDMAGYTGKRLYRNPDDRIFSGVAGGIAAYINKDAWVIRLIFAGPLALSILLSMLNSFGGLWHTDFFPNFVFGSVNATLCMIYIVLWIIIPEARTNYEKMEMRGERVDVNSIRQNVRDEMEGVKERVKTFSDEVGQTARKWASQTRDYANESRRNFANEAGDLPRRTTNSFGHVIGVIFKAFFLFIAGTVAFVLFGVLVALIFGGAAWWPINNFIWTSNLQKAYAWGSLIFFLGVPLIGLITYIVRRIMKIRSRRSYLGWTFGGLWTLGWICLACFAASMTADFRDKESVEGPVMNAQPRNGKMIIAVTEPELINSSNFMWAGDGQHGWDLNDDTLKLSHVNVSFDQSPDSSYHVSMIRYAFGNNAAEARKRASEVNYSLTVKDSLIDLGNGFAIGRDSKYRGQHVEILVLVPVGKQIRFESSINYKLNNVNVDWRRNSGWYPGRPARYRRSFNWESDIDYTMDNEGNLNSPQGEQVAPDNDEETDEQQPSYRYRDSKGTRDSLETIDQREERLKKELEEIRRSKNQQTDTSTGMESVDDETDEVASADWNIPGKVLVAFF